MCGCSATFLCSPSLAIVFNSIFRRIMNKMMKKYILYSLILLLTMTSCSNMLTPPDGGLPAFTYGFYRQSGGDYYIEEDDSRKILLENQDKNPNLIGKRFFMTGSVSSSAPEPYNAKFSVSLQEEMYVYQPITLDAKSELDNYRSDGIMLDKHLEYSYLWTYKNYVNFIFGVTVADYTKHQFRYFIVPSELENAGEKTLTIYVRHDASLDTELTEHNRELKLFYTSLDIKEYAEEVAKGSIKLKINYKTPQGVEMVENITVYTGI